MKSALAIQCLPVGLSQKEAVYQAVDRAIDAIRASGLPFTVGPFETVVEGPLDQLFKIAQEAHQAMLNGGVTEVATYCKIFSSPTLGSSAEKVDKYRAQGH